jgi:hypothetical protein
MPKELDREASRSEGVSYDKIPFFLRFHHRQGAGSGGRLKAAAMTYVAGYQHDMFISYAHVDNEPSIPGDDATRWVYTLRQSLQTRIDQKLGRNDAVNVWMDRGGLAGHEPGTPRIREAISKYNHESFAE